MDYGEMKERIRKEKEQGDITVYVPAEPDAVTAVQGVYFMNALAGERLTFADVNFKEYHEPDIRKNETPGDYAERLNGYEQLMHERRRDGIVFGPERGNIDTKNMNTDVVAEAGKVSGFVTELEKDLRKPVEKMSDISQVFYGMNPTKKEILNTKPGFNFCNAATVMSSVIMTRAENGWKNPCEVKSSIEEDILNNRCRIPVTAEEKDGIIKISVPQETARVQDLDGDAPAKNGMKEIARLTRNDLKEIGLLEKMEPVIDAGGREAFNEEGENITLTVHQLTDTWAKSKIESEITRAAESSAEIKTIDGNRIGSYFMEIAQAAERRREKDGTEIAGVTYRGKAGTVFKSVSENYRIPESYKGAQEAGVLPEGLSRISGRGLSVTISKGADVNGVLSAIRRENEAETLMKMEEADISEEIDFDEEEASL